MMYMTDTRRSRRAAAPAGHRTGRTVALGGCSLLPGRAADAHARPGGAVGRQHVLGKKAEDRSKNGEPTRCSPSCGRRAPVPLRAPQRLPVPSPASRVRGPDLRPRRPCAGRAPGDRARSGRSPAGRGARRAASRAAAEKPPAADGEQPASGSVRPGVVPPPMVERPSTISQSYEPDGSRAAATAPARASMDSGVRVSMRRTGTVSRARPAAYSVSVPASAAYVILSARNARISGCRRICASGSFLPRMMPACGPPRSLSPLTQTTSTPAARLCLGGRLVAEEGLEPRQPGRAEAREIGRLGQAAGQVAAAKVFDDRHAAPPAGLHQFLEGRAAR